MVGDDMLAGAMREHRPWEWIWRVASGDSAGHMTDRKEGWLAWVQRHTCEHMFAM